MGQQHISLVVLEAGTRMFAVERRWIREIVHLEEDDPRLIERFAGGRLLLHDGGLMPIVALGAPSRGGSVCVLEVAPGPVGLLCTFGGFGETEEVQSMPALQPADLPPSVIGWASTRAGRVWVLDPPATGRAAGIVPELAAHAPVPAPADEEPPENSTEFPILATQLGLALELELMMSKIADVEDEHSEDAPTNIIRMWRR